ncbi:helix-turn-helix domain-containing protein [Puia sp. P3]|uniref:helix-turn-helix domain-containing protein n=1 Tax=Puia sp. P3 TaxID=3423952 RepID=UPI003D666946
MADDFDIELNKLGERIKKIRKSRKLTLVDLQLASGIHDSDLSRIERGLDNIEFFTIFKIAKGLGLETRDLTDYDGPLPDYTSKDSQAPTKKPRRNRQK